MFNENSGLVKVWVGLVMSNAFTVDDVPDLSNLKDVVMRVINSMK